MLTFATNQLNHNPIMQIFTPNRSAFEKWLHENNLTYAAAGRHFGVSREYIRQIAAGEKTPGEELGKAILQALLKRPYSNDQ